MKTKYFILLALLAFFCACKGKSGYEVVNNSASSSADTVSKADTAAAQRLVKTAEMSFKVKNVNQTATRVNELTTDFGGMVMHQQVSSWLQNSYDVRVSRDSVKRVTSLHTGANITVKVPAVRLGKFMDSVASMGLYVTDRSKDISDKTLDYLSAQMKLKSRSDLIDAQKSGKVIIKDPTKVLNLSDDMIDQQMENRQIDDDVKNSVVNLSFYQSNTINKEVIVNDDPSAYDQPFFNRLLMACQNGWSLLINLIVGLANIWFLLLAGALVWLYIIRYKKAKRASLPVAGR